MPDVRIEFANPEQIQVLFGPRDLYLRRVRDVVGVTVVLRGDALTVRGDDDDSVRRGVAVIEDLRRVIERQGFLREDEVLSAISRHQPEPFSPDDDAIDLHERSKRVVPKTAGQAAYIQAIRENDLVFCCGPAGCGKSYLAVAMAVHHLRNEHVKKIVLVRPAVEAGEKLGFLPGDMLAKVNPFLRPLLDALHDILDHEQVNRYMERDVIEVVPLAFMRGRTLNNTFMILDEGQNTTQTQMKMFLTRMGHGSKIVVTGDVTQIDLPTTVTSGLVDAMERLRSINGIANVHLTGRDIVRHRLVRDIVKAYDQPQRTRGQSGDRT